MERSVADRWDQTEIVIGALIEVHRHLGPGLLESAYEKAVAWELQLRGIPFERQRPVRLDYKGADLDVGFRCDFVVHDDILLELKAVEALQQIHAAQVITYLRLTGASVGLLVNFNVRLLKTASNDSGSILNVSLSRPQHESLTTVDADRV